MAFGKLKWFSGKKDAKEKAEQLVREEFDSVKKLLRKQTIMVEELYRGQQAAATAGENRHTGHLIELCDSIFYLYRAFQSPGIMSRQHAQVLNMVMKKMERLSASLGLEMILEEGVSFDSRLHEAVANRSPGSAPLEVIEMVQPGYLQGGQVIRPARVVVGQTGEIPPVKGPPEL
ncbi:MAG: nucleotide exchange factor GrpE [Syntrophobacteraceae bacterium]